MYTVSASSGQLKFDPDTNKSNEITQDFDLTVRNHTSTAYILPKGATRSWQIRVYAPNSNRTDPICEQFESQDFPEILNAHTQRTVTLTCVIKLSNNFGTFEAEATFLPTREVIKVKFEIQPSSDANILFTGKLMGYFRFPNRQIVPDDSQGNGPHCANPSKAARPTSGEIREGEVLSPDAQVFIDAYGLDGKGVSSNTVLVGTGDNFAPNYYSRVFAFSRTQPQFETQPGKELYEWDLTTHSWKFYHPNNLSAETNLLLQQGKGIIPTDNVACFLAFAHFDAIVPGKHDFYYGAERLRKLGRLLASIPKDNYFQPTQMLAANLMIKTVWAKDHSPISDGNKPALSFLTKYLATPPPAKTISAVRLPL
jgi:hypothetical protein